MMCSELMIGKMYIYKYNIDIPQSARRPSPSYVYREHRLDGASLQLHIDDVKLANGIDCLAYVLEIVERKK